MSFLSRLFRVLGQLLLALLNATLLLALALAVVVLLILGRVQDLSGVARTAVQAVVVPQSERLDKMSTRLDTLQGALERCEPGPELKAQIAGLNEQVGQVRTGLQSLQQVDARALAQAFVSELGRVISERLSGAQSLPPS